MVATGTGLAPIKSILESLMDDPDCPPVSLYWGMRTEDDLYLHDEIQSWAERLCDFQYVPVLSRPGVYISAGHTGHGFGIGPAAGRLAADLIRGDAPSVDPRPFRYERMIDGSDLGSMGMM